MKQPGPQILLSAHGKGYRLVLLVVSYHYLSAGNIRCTIVSQELCTDALSTGTLPPYGDFRGIPAKGIDIFLYLMERKPLISETKIRRPAFQGLSPAKKFPARQTVLDTYSNYRLPHTDTIVNDKAQIISPIISSTHK